MYKKYKVNSSYFDTIDTESKAYWLGFICSDGNIVNHRNAKNGKIKKEYRLKIAIDEGDLEHLEKLKIDIGSNHKISFETKKNQQKRIASLSIWDKNIVSKLVNMGLENNKTFSLKPILLNNKLERHFWRGMIDGDGHIEPINNKSRQSQISLSGNKLMTNKFLSFIIENKIETKSKPFKDKSIYRMSFCGNYIAKKVGILLYGKSTIFLNRKKDTIDELLLYVPQQEKRESITEEKIINAINKSKNYKEAAKFLNIGYTTLWRYMKNKNMPNFNKLKHG